MKDESNKVRFILHPSSFRRSLLRFFFLVDDLAALVVAAVRADTVRQARLLATLTVLDLHRSQVLMASTFALTGSGGPSLGDSHGCSAFCGVLAVK
jgi:hypothetical protein